MKWDEVPFGLQFAPKKKKKKGVNPFAGHVTDQLCDSRIPISNIKLNIARW